MQYELFTIIIMNYIIIIIIFIIIIITIIINLFRQNDYQKKKERGIIPGILQPMQDLYCQKRLIPGKGSCPRHHTLYNTGSSSHTNCLWAYYSGTVSHYHCI